MREVERFKAYDDAGATYDVVVRQSMLDGSSMDGSDAIPGLKEYRLASGGPVNQISETEFKVVATGKIIRRR